MNDFEEFRQREENMMQASAQIAKMLDTLKTDLETRGWNPTEAVQASIAMSNTILMMSGRGF